MKLSDFDYDLPADRIAQRPCEKRDDARLLVHDAGRSMTEHRMIRELPELLSPGDLLIVNDTRVRPARLHAKRKSGGAVELLLTTPVPHERLRWRSLVKPAARIKPGEVLEVAGGALEVTAVERPLAPDGQPESEWIVEFGGITGGQVELDEVLQRFGHLPLPPYIRRDERHGGEDLESLDRERYQTVYARELGAVAAPTAGLHFTQELLAELERRGIERASVTLHVGLGTFLPVTTDDVAEHRMHSEEYVLPQETADRIRACRERSGRVVCVGTTSLRVVESCALENGLVQPGAGSTDLFVTPGYRLRVVDALLTNFHLPRSTLLMLVSALCGRERILELYEEAIERGYRFFSYGDAMLLLGRA